MSEHLTSWDLVGPANALSAALREGVSMEECCRRVLAAHATEEYDCTAWLLTVKTVTGKVVEVMLSPDPVDARLMPYVVAQEPLYRHPTPPREAGAGTRELWRAIDKHGAEVARFATFDRAEAYVADAANGCAEVVHVGEYPLALRPGAVPEAPPVAWAIRGADGAFRNALLPWAQHRAEIEAGHWDTVKPEAAPHALVPLYTHPAPVAPCERCADRERSGYRIAGEPCSEAQAQEVGKLFAERDGLRDEVARLRQQHVANTNPHPDAAARDAARLDWLADDPPFDELGDTDIHETAFIVASEDGREEATAADYRIAMRRVIDAAMRASDGEATP